MYPWPVAGLPHCVTPCAPKQAAFVCRVVTWPVSVLTLALRVFTFASSAFTRAGMLLVDLEVALDANCAATPATRTTTRPTRSFVGAFIRLPPLDRPDVPVAGGWQPALTRP